MAVANRQTDSATDRIDVVHAMRPNNDKFQFFNRRFQLRTNSRRYVVAYMATTSEMLRAG